MRFLVGLLLCLGLSGCLLGCSTKAGHHGEIGFRYGTEVAFFSRASQTAPEPATFEVEVPSLTEWLFPADESNEPVEP